jgi:hypothetical protein
MVLAAPSTNDAEMGERKLKLPIHEIMCKLTIQHTGPLNRSKGKEKAKPKFPSLNKWTKTKMKICPFCPNLDVAFYRKDTMMRCLLLPLLRV